MKSKSKNPLQNPFPYITIPPSTVKTWPVM